MEYLDTPVTTASGACPVCSSRTEDGAVFCARCGAFLKDETGKRPQKRSDAMTSPSASKPANGASARALDGNMVNLLAEITQLQRDLLRQFRQSQALQARQFERALQAQALSLEKTLAHADGRVQATEERLTVWQRLTVGLAAALFVLFAVASQVV